MNLSERNLTATVIAFVKYKEKSFYCFGETEYWKGTGWEWYLKSNENIEEKYLNI